jgi:putative transposase
MKIAPRLVDCMETNVSEGFMVFTFPRANHKILRTSYFLECISQEIKRRTRIVQVFSNECSHLRLKTASRMEANEEWEYGRIYLN